MNKLRRMMEPSRNLRSAIFAVGEHDLMVKFAGAVGSEENDILNQVMLIGR